jgi:hypothetical protein
VAAAAQYISDAAIAQVVILITTLSSLVFQIYRENRQRRWTVEDRTQAEASRKLIRTRLDQHTTQLAENTKISRDAFDQANHVNEKIARIGGALLTHTKSPHGPMVEVITGAAVVEVTPQAQPAPAPELKKVG